jgi:hypothetical protein
MDTILGIFYDAAGPRTGPRAEMANGPAEKWEEGTSHGGRFL